MAILPATILAADKCIIENLPDISDVAVSLQILSALGAQIRMLTKNSYEIDTSHITATQVPDELSRQMRASYYFLGALLGRFGSGKEEGRFWRKRAVRGAFAGKAEGTIGRNRAEKGARRWDF